MKTGRIPCPLEIIDRHPPLKFMSGAAYRAAWCIAVSYWQAECPAKALDDMALSALARMNSSQWTHIKREVTPAIAALLPLLASRYQALAAKRAKYAATMRDKGMRGRAGTLHRQKLAAIAEAEKNLHDVATPATRHARPVTKAPYVNPRAPLPPRELADIGRTTRERQATSHESKAYALLRDE
jgi:hypothetical protein